MSTMEEFAESLRDRYVLELGPEAREIDRRLVAAFAVGLDSLQDR